MHSVLNEWWHDEQRQHKQVLNTSGSETFLPSQQAQSDRSVCNDCCMTRSYLPPTKCRSSIRAMHPASSLEGSLRCALTSFTKLLTLSGLNSNHLLGRNSPTKCLGCLMQIIGIPPLPEYACIRPTKIARVSTNDKNVVDSLYNFRTHDPFPMFSSLPSKKVCRCSE